jgi:hypothetical protein
MTCCVVAGSAWGLASTLGAMRQTAKSLSEANIRLAAPVKQKVEKIELRRPRLKRAETAERIIKPTENELRRRKLTPDAIRMAHQRGVEAKLAALDKRRKEEKAIRTAAMTRALRLVDREATITEKSTLVTALAEDVPFQELQPFGLVLAKPETEDELALPSQVPLPEARPLIERAVVEDEPVAEKISNEKPADEKPADEKPASRAKRDKKDEAKDVAYAKPERSLFGDLFKSRTGDKKGWLGKGTKVAIYDVSSATVYMPDGTKLKAHSGIGHMRDNPRYEHVKMRGPTPAGIYRLSMREKRFYGVEAIRMTSIDGRHPKNRTGLLTHTNLLRGQKGSHGCVAFVNYQPFLRAFKRGQITMLVVVPELPSSRTQLAALYRKAGA